MNVVLAFTLEGMVYNSFLSAKLMAETPSNKRQITRREALETICWVLCSMGLSSNRNQEWCVLYGEFDGVDSQAEV